MTEIVCALADHHGCAGVLSERRTAGGETVFPCARHEAADTFAWTGVLPALRKLATAPERRMA